MLIRDWMTRTVHVLKPLDTVQHARELMEKLRINQMPVVFDGKLVGIVSDRDVRDASPSVFENSNRRRRPPAGTDPRSIAVEDVMSPGLLTVSPDESIAAAARLMGRERIGAVPVVENGRLVGILARSDMLKALVAIAETGASPKTPSPS
jgi:acetoin utilization protein AcuB